jgi:hypothetical protein
MKLFAIIFSLVIFGSLNLHALECFTTTSLNTAKITNSLSSKCRNIKRKEARKQFINRKFSQIKKIEDLLTESSWKALKQGRRKLIRRNCADLSNSLSLCNSSEVISGSEIVEQIPKMGCTQIYSEERKEALRTIRKTFDKLEEYFGTEINTQVAENVNMLLKSKSCGEGGSDLLKYCNGIYETADGIGQNVYKLLEYAPYLPIFITRDDAQVCTARRKTGTVIEELRYTGLANPDSAGLRHHYRFSRTCDRLPELFYIECAGRCYEINDTCGRID